MMLLPCPWCGYRNVSEFAYGGELVVRPDPATTTREEWRAYLYLRDNPAGLLAEGWYHRAGCRKFFKAVRDTTDNTVLETSRLAHAAAAPDNVGAAEPRLDNDGAAV